MVTATKITVDRKKNILRNILRMPRKITKINLRWHLDSWGILMSVDITSSKHLGISATKQQNKRDIQIIIKKHTVVIYIYLILVTMQCIMKLNSCAQVHPPPPGTPTPNQLPTSLWHTHEELSNWCKCLTRFFFILFLLLFIWRVGRFYILQLINRNWSKIQNSPFTRFGFT